MNLTIEMIKENFDVINELFFDNELKTPEFQITSVKSYLGLYHYRYDWYDGSLVESTIYISDYFDRSEEDIVNTIAHEMIHLYIRQNNIKDTRPHHGRVFNQIADRLNREGGFHIARTDSVAGCGLRDKTKKSEFIIACFQDANRKYFCFRINKNYINHYIYLFERQSHWYTNPYIFKTTDDKAFAHYRECRKSVRGWFIDKEMFDLYRETQDLIYTTEVLSVKHTAA